MNSTNTYGSLCTLFYNATKTYAQTTECDFYASFIEQNPGRVLEAMSGSGRLQIPLMQRGYTVDGVDTSKAMLESCRNRCQQLNLAAELYQQSLQNLATPHQYATVTIAVGSFQLIFNKTEALQSLLRIRKHMQNQGSNLLIDLFIPEINTEKHEVRLARINPQSIIRLTTRKEFYPAEMRADVFCNYELITYGVVEHSEHELMQITWYHDTEFEELLHQSGFSLFTIHEKQLRPSGPSRIVQAQPITK